MRFFCGLLGKDCGLFCAWDSSSKMARYWIMAARSCPVVTSTWPGRQGNFSITRGRDESIGGALLKAGLGVSAGLMFVFAGAEHELTNGFAGVFAFVEDEFHLLGNGHFDRVTAGEAEGGAGGEDAFGDFAVEAGEDFREFAALA